MHVSGKVGGHDADIAEDDGERNQHTTDHEHCNDNDPSDVPTEKDEPSAELIVELV